MLLMALPEQRRLREEQTTPFPRALSRTVPGRALRTTSPPKVKDNEPCTKLEAVPKMGEGLVIQY